MAISSSSTLGNETFVGNDRILFGMIFGVLAFYFKL